MAASGSSFQQQDLSNSGPRVAKAVRPSLAATVATPKWLPPGLQCNALGGTGRRLYSRGPTIQLPEIALRSEPRGSKTTQLL